MTVKNILFTLLLTLLSSGALAQDPPAADGNTATNRDALLRRALEAKYAAQSNAPNATVPAAPATATGAPPVRPVQSPFNRLPIKRPGAASASPTATPPGTAPAEATDAAVPSPVAPALGALEPGAVVVTASPASAISDPDKIMPPLSINFSAAPLDQVLEIYCEYVGRNLLRPATLPKVEIVLRQTTPLTKLELVHALEAALALNQVSVVNVGEKFVTVVPTTDAGKIAGHLNTNDVTQLPDLGSVVTRVVQLKYTKPADLVQILTPFASGAAPNPVLPIDASGIIVLRDNVANVKRMLEMIEKVDITMPSEIISEVIPIKYAKAEEIASALSSVGGGTGGTVGSRPSSTGTGAAGGASRFGQPGYNPNQPGGLGGMGGLGQTGGGIPTPSSGTSFNDRLQNIIRKASSSGDIQLLGQTKIIADIRSNSLLVFATRQDMATIKEIIDKLDVVLAQVLVETLIMDVTLGDDWNFGVSAAQKTKKFNQNFTGAGGMNANTFFDFSGGSNTNAFGDLLGSGIKYFGKVNEDIYISVAAAASAGKVKVIQRPRIQTSHATPATLFIGSTVPYVTSTYYGGGFGGGPSSSYQQLRVGIGLNVTPFINQEGLVVMKIEETIDELDGTTTIEGVGAVPNTKSSTLSAEIAVRDGESVILGGIVRNSDSKSNGGVPYLKDIPLLGYLFRSTTSNKKRQESIVLMRPTVLRTPELASQQVDIERRHMPGISEAESSIRLENEKAEAAEAKRLQKERQSEARLANQVKKEDQDALKTFAPPASPAETAPPVEPPAKKKKSTKPATPPASEEKKFDEVTPFTPEEEKLFLPK